MSLKNIILTGVAAVAFSAASVPAFADLSLNQWYTGEFGSAMGTALFGPALTGSEGTNGPSITTTAFNGGPYVAAGVNAISAPATSWQIALTAPAVITFLDMEVPMDQFKIFANGMSIGTTSTPSLAVDTCAVDITCALSTPGYSRGSFALGVGLNVITGVTVGDSVPGDVSFIIEPGSLPTGAPEPATLAVLGAGLAGLGVMRRRKSSV